MSRQANLLELVQVVVPRAAVPAYEAAMAPHCRSLGIFEEDDEGVQWRIEGVREAAAPLGPLQGALLLAELISGVAAELLRAPTPNDGWLARVHAAFPEQKIGRRFAVRGTHLPAGHGHGRVVLRIDAGLAFGSGEHGSTRGCLRALEHVARGGRKQHMLDVGCGSGILAMGGAALFRRAVLAVDIDPWSVRVTRENARANRLHRRIRPLLGSGTQHRLVAAGAPYDLIFANILARPLCRMAHGIAAVCAPRGHVILAGLLHSQARMVLAAYRAQGVIKILSIQEGPWTTLLLQRR